MSHIDILKVFWIFSYSGFLDLPLIVLHISGGQPLICWLVRVSVRISYGELHMGSLNFFL